MRSSAHSTTGCGCILYPVLYMHAPNDCAAYLSESSLTLKFLARLAIPQERYRMTRNGLWLEKKKKEKKKYILLSCLKKRTAAVVSSLCGNTHTSWHHQMRRYGCQVSVLQREKRREPDRERVCEFELPLSSHG